MVIFAGARVRKQAIRDVALSVSVRSAARSRWEAEPRATRCA
jgi:hypothetical protein